MGQMEFLQYNINNLSRSGEKDVTLVEHQEPIPLREFYLIVEGENTERFYINYLKEKNKLPFEIKTFEKDADEEKANKWKIIDGIKCLCGGNYLQKIDTIEKINKGIASVPGMRPNIICIFDLDICFKKDGETKHQQYKDLLKKYKAYDNIIFCASMPSIEYWFLLHYEGVDVNKFYKTCTSVIKADSELSKIKKAKTFWNTEYSKNWVKDVLCEDSNLNRAITRAKMKANKEERLEKVSNPKDCNISYSDMYKLFEIK